MEATVCAYCEESTPLPPRRAAIITLGDLSRTAEGRVLLLSCPQSEKLLATMKAVVESRPFIDELLVIKTIRALGNICVDNDDHRYRIQSAGIISSIISASTLPQSQWSCEDHVLQFYMMLSATLMNMCVDNATIQASVLEEGGVGALVSGLETIGPALKRGEAGDLENAIIDFSIRALSLLATSNAGSFKEHFMRVSTLSTSPASLSSSPLDRMMLLVRLGEHALSSEELSQIGMVAELFGVIMGADDKPEANEAAGNSDGDVDSSDKDVSAQSGLLRNEGLEAIGPDVVAWLTSALKLVVDCFGKCNSVSTEIQDSEDEFDEQEVLEVLAQCLKALSALSAWSPSQVFDCIFDDVLSSATSTTEQAPEAAASASLPSSLPPCSQVQALGLEMLARLSTTSHIVQHIVHRRLPCLLCWANSSALALTSTSSSLSLPDNVVMSSPWSRYSVLTLSNVCQNSEAAALVLRYEGVGLFLRELLHRAEEMLQADATLVVYVTAFIRRLCLYPALKEDILKLDILSAMHQVLNVSESLLTGGTQEGPEQTKQNKSRVASAQQAKFHALIALRSLVLLPIAASTPSVSASSVQEDNDILPGKAQLDRDTHESSYLKEKLQVARQLLLQPDFLHSIVNLYADGPEMPWKQKEDGESRIDGRGNTFSQGEDGRWLKESAMGENLNRDESNNDAGAPAQKDDRILLEAGRLLAAMCTYPDIAHGIVASESKGVVLGLLHLLVESKYELLQNEGKKAIRSLSDSP